MGYLIFHVFSLRWIELFRATSVMLIVMGIEKVGMLCYYNFFIPSPRGQRNHNTLPLNV